MIASPNPYVITSGTTITTDPAITTNGQTDYGKIWRGPAQDGLLTAFLFGSTSAFDVSSGFDQDIGNGSGAAFKFTALQLTGDPTISTTNGEINLGLVGVNSITSGSPGGTLTFAGIRGLLLATENGPITLGPEISFSGFHDLTIYARGSSSDLTLGSDINTSSRVSLYAERDMNVSSNITTEEFGAVAGRDITINAINAVTISLSATNNLNWSGGTFSATATNSDGNVDISAGNQISITNGLEIDRTFGGFSGLNVSLDAGTDLAAGSSVVVNIDNSVDGNLDSGADITLNTGNNLTINGSGGLFLTINNGNGGQIGTGGNIFVTTGGDFTANALTSLINDRNGGSIGTGANMIFSIDGALMISNDLTMGISTRNDGSGGGTIGSSAVVNLNAGSVSVGGAFTTFVSTNAGGHITGDAFNLVNITGDLVVQGPVLVDIEDTGFNQVDPITFIAGGNIGGSATVTLSARNITTFSTASGIPGTDTMSLEASIYSNGSGTIGGDAIVDVFASQNISAPGTAFFTVANGNFMGTGGGTISGDARTNVTATNLSTGALFDDIYNYGGGSIGRDATISLDISNSFVAIGDTRFEIFNSGGMINRDASVAVSAADMSALSVLAEIDNSNSGVIGSSATISFDIPGNVTVANDATFTILGSSTSTPTAAININGGTYDVGGSFLARIADDGAITFNNANIRADIVKVGVLGSNGTLIIGGGTISADTLLKLYAPGSNGSIDFVANVTLSSQSTATIIAANTVTIFNGVLVTIGGSDPASVFTNIANYTGSGGNGSTTGMFGGAGAVTNPLSHAPPFDGTGASAITYLGAPAGNWSDPASWNPNVVPDNSGGNTYNASQSSGMLIQDIVGGVTIEQFQMSGGTLRLDNPLTLNAGLQFSGGTMAGGDLFVVGSSTQSATMGVNGTTITNSGAYNITFDGSDLFAGSATFNNSGTLSKTTGTGTDNFNIGLNNSGTVSAQNGTLRFVVGATSAGAFSASAGATVEFASNWIFINGTHFSGAGAIQLDNNTTTNLSGTITNTGAILLNAGANLTDLRISDGTTLTGGGSVILSDSPYNRIYGAANSGTETLTNVNNTISGAGQIGISNSIELINQSAGVINATSGSNALVISPTTNGTVVNANGGGFVNQGLLEATGAGGLVLSGGQFNNKGGTIEAIGSGNNVFLENGVTISGGTLSDSGGGLIQTASGHNAFLDGTSQGALTNVDTYQGTNNSATFLNGTITNAGTILLNSGGNFTDLHISDGTTLTGGGSVILSDSPNNRIFGAANSGTETLTNVNNTISGAGQIGISNSIELINQSAGVINATSGSNALVISPTTNGTVVNANGGGFVNQGLLEATGAGGLVLSGGQFNNKGGTIEAIGGGNNVSLENNVTISGGTLSDSGGGLIQTASGHNAFLDGTTQGALTNADTYQGTNNSATFLNGTITNTGTILLNAGANLTDLRISDGTTLTGGGSVILSDSPYNRIYGATNSGTETLTNVNNTISGAGQIGVSNSIELINQSAGVINATSGSNALVISPTTNGTVVNANGGGFVNQGLLEATGAGGLVLSGGQFNNKGGTIEAIGSGNNVFLENGVTISGGTLSDSGGGLIQTASGHNAFLDGTTQGALTNVDTYQGTNNSATFLNGTITNAGTILLNSSGNFTDLHISDGTTLTGGGSVILSDSPYNRIYGAANSGTETLTNVNNTISGAGQIGISNSIEFLNQSAGVINATGSNALIISPTTNSNLVSANGGGFVNQGLLEATGGGGLVLSGGQFNNKGGMIEAIGSGNNVFLENGVTISGGTLSDSGGGLIQTASGHNAFLDGTSQGALTNADTYQGTNNSATFLSGTITNNGTIVINSSGNFTDLHISDGTTLTGGGSVILSDSPNNRIFGATNSGTETLTNVNNTISGAGQIGVSNSIELINQSAGVINATSGSNALIISPTTNSTVVNANGGGFVNQGLLEATGGGGLVLSGGQFNNTGGVILVDGAASQVQLINSASVAGGTLRTINGGNFSIDGSAAVDQITGTSGAITMTATAALSAVNGIDFSGVNGADGGTLTLNGPSAAFGPAAGEINGALFNGAAGSGTTGGASGGTFTLNATGPITVSSDIEATTGFQANTIAPSGNGGTVNLTSSGDTVTVNNRIEVSSAPSAAPPPIVRRSAKGGNIGITSGKTSGVAINISSSAQLLALLDAAAPGPGGKITILASAQNGNSSSVNVNGRIQADGGTVDIRHAGDNGVVNLNNADVRADVLKVATLGSNGTLNIGGGTLSADTTLKLYSAGSNGTVNFIADVSLNGASTKIIAGNTVNIFNNVVVTIGGANPANVYTNHANYTGFGGNGSRTGTFGGAGANNPQPLSSAPPLD